MKALLVGCGQRKLDHPAPARELYTGCLFSDRRVHAEASGAPWFILSALHGIIEPSQVIAPYDARLCPWTARNQMALLNWAKACLRQLRPLTDGTPIEAEIHAGADYVAPFAYLVRLQAYRTVRNSAFTFTHPVAGLGQGQQRAWYHQRRNPQRLLTL